MKVDKIDVKYIYFEMSREYFAHFLWIKNLAILGLFILKQG